MDCKYGGDPARESLTWSSVASNYDPLPKDQDSNFPTITTVLDDVAPTRSVVIDLGLDFEINP